MGSNNIPRERRIPRKLIPELPPGIAPFQDTDIIRRNINTQLHRIDISDLTTVNDAIKQLNAVKRLIAEKLGCKLKDLPELAMDPDGPEYEGYYWYDVSTNRWETDDEVKKRLDTKAKQKIASFKNRNKEKAT